MSIARLQAARLATALVLGAGFAAADPIINIVYDPTVSFTAADKTQIQNAINFFTSNMTSTFTLTIALGEVSGGGAQTNSFLDTATYSAYYNALVNNSSTDATDIAAITSLGTPSANNPVTGSTQVKTSSTLSALLGIGSQVSNSFAGCGGVTASACIQVGSDVLNVSGSPAAGLFGIVEHEFDEVLGTTSALPSGGGTLPTDPSAADLFRYSAPGSRSFALNTSTGVPCTGTPTAYFSIDSGVTNLDQYNNCNNGGDYGDWIYTDGLQVQDAFGPDNVASSLSLSSPEVTLLDAVGYNFQASISTPEPSSLVLLLLTVLIAIPVLRRRPAGDWRTVRQQESSGE